ncbi:MAG: phosphate propanoyltransferase [Actinomycetota bacterium]|nr:phosphate propanoyltransferase [Actinomycetota bacterium]
MDTEKLIQDVVKNVMQKLSVGIIPSSQTPDNTSESIENNGKLKMAQNVASDRKIVCSISVKHVHLCREHLDVLYGKDYEPTIFKELYQPNNYAYKETVTIVGPKLNAIQNVRILGPLRNKSQVELAKTDCIILGIDAPVKPSGKLEGTSSCVLIGPKGAVYLKEGVIRANRHIHLSEEDADYFGIKDNDEVDVRVSGPKGLTFNNVQVRVGKDFVSEMHIDTDDGNAADVVNGTLVEIVNASCIAPIGPSTIADLSKIPPGIPDNSISGEITDPNILKNINNITSQSDVGLASSASSNITGSYGNIGSAKTLKTVITVADLDNYKASGIRLSDDVILSPLAKDEALARGIKILS